MWKIETRTGWRKLGVIIFALMSLMTCKNRSPLETNDLKSGAYINSCDIYVDMDGVLTDFLGQITNLNEGEEVPEDQRWTKINSWGLKFWEDMPWLPEGKKLWEGLKKYQHVKILSSCGHPERAYCKDGKLNWISRELGQGWRERAIIYHQKDVYAKLYVVLIEDWNVNIEKWRNKGGTGILHTNAAETLRQLKEKCGG
jgi:hypothetical protein